MFASVCASTDAIHRTAPPLPREGPEASAGPFRREAAGPAEPEVEPAPPETETLEEEDTGRGTDDPWFVVLYNDEVHTFEEVINQIMKATGCARGRAEDLTWTVHNEGKATVYEGTFEECFEVQGVLQEIQLVTEIKG
jgi:ATP-dependent Clp protease adapter protein ClpS